MQIEDGKDESKTIRIEKSWLRNFEHDLMADWQLIH